MVVHHRGLNFCLSLGLSILLYILFYNPESYLLTKIGRIRNVRGWSGKRVVMKFTHIITDSANAFVRVSLSCWSVVILGGWGRIRVTVELA